MKELIAAVDIGSTFTKGALFARRDGRLQVLGRAVFPTTREDLAVGFFQVLDELASAGPPGTERGSFPVRFSSSAKGGLRIAAVGLVPDLTLQVARLAAWSAGGKIVGDSSYRLTTERMEGLLAGDPDILLFVGGTEGGHERYILGNAEIVAASDFTGTVVYGGNSAVRPRVREILRDKKILEAENVMPEIGVMSTDSAREAIQGIFLDTIVQGRGLARVRDFCGADPRPTPLAVFELVSLIGRERPQWGDFCVLDPGGATTDFYSSGEAFREGEGVLLKGIQEPRVKRSVEGDLGLRMGASSLVEEAEEYLREEGELRGISYQALRDYAADLAERRGGAQPGSPRELEMDHLLCEAAAATAVLRHAGSLEGVYYPTGRVFIQQGKDLRSCRKLIGTGGFLSRHDLGPGLRRAFGRIGSRIQGEKIPLVPGDFRFYRDSLHLFPLLGSLAEDFPREAAACAIFHLSAEEARTRV